MNAITKVEASAVALTPQATSVSPIAMMLQAIASGVTLDQMQGVLAVQKEWEANEARKAYVAAMSAFKLNPPDIFKSKSVGYTNRDGTFTGYKHATLGDVSDAITNGLAAHGFSHRWDTQQDEHFLTVTCAVTHSLGHSEVTRMTAHPDDSGKKNAIQQVASAVTYLQRYTLLAATGLATKDCPPDDDGAGTTATALDREVAKVPQPVTPMPAPMPYPPEMFSTNLPGWHDVIAKGRKTVAQIITMVESKSARQFTEAQKKSLAALPVAA